MLELFQLSQMWSSLLTLLQLELLNARLIGRDGGALDGNAILLGSLGGLNGDLVVGLVTVFQTQVVVLQVNVEVSTSHSLSIRDQPKHENGSEGESGRGSQSGTYG